MVIFGFYKWRLYPESKNAFGIGNCKDMFSGLRRQRQDLGHFGLWIQLGWCRTWKQRDFWLTKYVDILSPSYEKQMKNVQVLTGLHCPGRLKGFPPLDSPRSASFISKYFTRYYKTSVSSVFIDSPFALSYNNNNNSTHIYVHTQIWIEYPPQLSKKDSFHEF